jgi:hypothetical protein
MQLGFECGRARSITTGFLPTINKNIKQTGHPAEKMSDVDEFRRSPSQFMQAQEVDYKISFDYLLSSSSGTPVTAED